VRRHHVVGIAAVISDPRNLAFDASNEIAAPAIDADPAMTAMPADAGALADLPLGDAVAERVNTTRNLMTGHAGVVDAGEVSLDGEGVAMTDATSVDFDAHLAGAQLGHLALD
jgi:hypothetical protein